MSATLQNQKIRWVIIAVSVAVPLVVALLMFMPQALKIGNLDVSGLPKFHAFLNSCTALCLLGAFLFIRQKNEQMHRNLMLGAFVLSSVFLVSYVVYHSQGIHTVFGDANTDGILSEEERMQVGGLRGLYLLVLLSHIALATIVLPLVLFAFYYALSRQIEKHKKLVKFAYPIWLYVAVTGVLVYFMISPYYPQ
jgi:putative membrane protein